MIAVEATRKVESDAYFLRLIRQHSFPVDFKAKV